MISTGTAAHAEDAALFGRLVQERLVPTIWAMLLAVFLYAIFGVLDWYIFPEHASKIWGIRVAWLLIGCTVTALAVWRRDFFLRHSQGLLALALLSAGLGIVGMTVIIAQHPRADVYYAGLILVVAYTVCVPIRTRMAMVVAVSILAAYDISMALQPTPPQAAVAIGNNCFLIAACIIVGFTGYTHERAMLQGFRDADLIASQNAEIEAERRRADALLCDILPAAIADKLMHGNSQIADGYADVTVLFADLAGFTGYSTTVSPRVLVRTLNLVFTGFDEVAERYGVEKIKTIGDAYMAVCGLPDEVDDHPVRTVQMAIAMQQEFSSIRSEIQGFDVDLRIGIHTGPCVAGVIGRKRFLYDLWGDTVNLASRMESTGLDGRIQVSEATFRRVRHAFDFEPARQVSIKGRGVLTAYVLKAGESASLAA